MCGNQPRDKTRKTAKFNLNCMKALNAYEGVHVFDTQQYEQTTQHTQLSTYSDTKHDGDRQIDGHFIQNTELQTTPSRGRFFSVDESDNVELSKKTQSYFAMKNKNLRQEGKLQTLSEKSQSQFDQKDESHGYIGNSVDSYFKPQVPLNKFI